MWREGEEKADRRDSRIPNPVFSLNTPRAFLPYTVESPCYFLWKKKSVPTADEMFGNNQPPHTPPWRQAIRPQS